MVLLAVALKLTVRWAPAGHSPTNAVAFAVWPSVMSPVSDWSETVDSVAFSPLFWRVSVIGPSSPTWTFESVETTSKSSSLSPGVTPKANGPAWAPSSSESVYWSEACIG